MTWFFILPLIFFFSMTKTLIIRTFVWIHMTEVPTSMYFLFTLFIWNLLRCTVPTVCQPSPIIELFFRGFFLPKPGVDKRLLGPTEEGGRLAAIGPGAGGSGVPFVICKLHFEKYHIVWYSLFHIEISRKINQNTFLTRQ